MAAPKTVVDAEQANTAPAAASPGPAAPAAKPARVVRFWKGFSPFEPIKLPNGREIVFGRESYATADEKLIELLKAVAKDYNILVQE